jgi:amidase
VRRYVTEIDGERMQTHIDWMKSCYYVGVAGLPVGIQIVGRYGYDFSVLQLAHALEGAARHGEHRPPLAG